MSPFIKVLLGAAAGAALGFLYHKLIGCRSGACPIAGNPWISSGWWALIGGLLASGLR